MALTRKQWNNIIILASAAMISVLTILHNKTVTIPDDAIPLFDQHTSLHQLELNGYRLTQKNQSWHCRPQLKHCQTWQQAWQQLKISPVAKPNLSSAEFKPLRITVKQSIEPILWRFYPEDGILESASGNWYKIPPSLQKNLLPQK